MLSVVPDVQISAIGAAVPKQVVSVAEYAKDLVSEKDAKRLTKSTGFSHLRICDEKTNTSDLCLCAASSLLLHLDEIDACLFVTQTTDYSIPATSHLLGHKLGLKSDALCLDINEGCSGYVQGVYLSSLLVSSGQCRNVLLLAGDTISKLTSPKDRGTCCIFGDAGTATLISRKRERERERERHLFQY